MLPPVPAVGLLREAGAPRQGSLHSLWAAQAWAAMAWATTAQAAAAQGAGGFGRLGLEHGPQAEVQGQPGGRPSPLERLGGGGIAEGGWKSHMERARAAAGLPPGVPVPSAAVRPRWAPGSASRAL